MSQFQAVILAAGLGSRLRGFANGLPKSLMRIGEKTFLQIHLENFQRFGIKDVIIVVGFKEKMIKKEIDRLGINLNIEFVTSHEYKTTNHGWSLFLTNEAIAKNPKPLLIAHADTYYQPDILTTLIESTAEDLVLVDSNFEVITNDELLVFGEGGRVDSLEYADKAVVNQTCLGEFIGLHKFSYEFSMGFMLYLEQHFTQVGRNDGYDWLLGRYVHDENVELRYELIDSPNWINVNHEDDYKAAERIYKELNRL